MDKNKNQLAECEEIMNKVVRDSDLYDVLEEIKPRPGLFLGTNNLKNLNQFLNGFFYGQYKYNKICEEQTDIFPLSFWFFHEFVKNYYNKYESTSGWCNMILSEVASEEKALNKFYELIDVYKNLRITNSWEIIVDEEMNSILQKSTKAPRYSKSIEELEILKPFFPILEKIIILELAGNYGYLCALETEEKIVLLKVIKTTKSSYQNYFDNIFDKKLIWKEIRFDDKLTKGYYTMPGLGMFK